MQLIINDTNQLTDTDRAVLRALANAMLDTHELSVPPPLANIFVDLGDSDRAVSMRVPEDAPSEESPVPVELAEVFSRAPQTHDMIVDTDCRTGDLVRAVPTPVAPAPASAELDSRGLPWDKRIHSANRTKNGDGSWRNMRGVDGDLLVQVEKELTGVMAIPAPEPVEAAAPAIVPVPPAPPAEAAAPALPVAPMTFAEMMTQHVTPLLVSRKLNQVMLASIVTDLGLPHFAALGARPDLIPRALELVNAALEGAA